MTIATIRDMIFCEILINLMTNISDIEDKKMEIKKVLAVVMSLCIVGGNSQLRRTCDLTDDHRAG